jgi:hypothetical protein
MPATLTKTRWRFLSHLLIIALKLHRHLKLGDPIAVQATTAPPIA